MSKTWNRISFSIMPVLLVLVVWEAVSRLGFINALLFPPPTIVLHALWSMTRDGTLPSDAAMSLWRVFVGLSIGVMTGVCIGLMTGRIQRVDRMLSPIIQTLRPLPPVAIIPLLIVWLGIGDGAKIFAIALAVFFPVWLSAHIGAKQIAQEYIWSAELLTQSRTRLFLQIILPASLPFIITGIRTAISTAFIMVFVSELAGAESGLGYRISITQLAYRVDEMMAALVVLALLSVLCDRMFSFALTRFCPWLSLNR